ncbi:putative Glycosyl transferase, family 2 [Bradyrhizobium sp. ORS 375]|uniref:glycosyltransferase n=1 Tax=Bradyrhizobium sp. (strain ORS 375) TaxID=566679 RepID=UPI0002409084|nr:glycosyltransferase [Bradyrhizobium sp. ORS 375]CCD91567.1 putative Glycosyl transferase, family 2 [Bradyrhizobium sp. ORS 375]
MDLALSIAWLVCVAWLIARASRQQALLPSLGSVQAPNNDYPGVCVIIPARDEACNLAACLQDLDAQDYPRDRLAILVVDDSSRDESLAIAQSFAARSPLIRPVSSPPLRPGWVGKPQACWTGAQAAPAGAEWLCFIDADVRAEPSLLTRAVRTAEYLELDLLSLAPRQELVSFPERLLIPCGFYLLAFTQDLATLQRPESPGVTVSGQFMLVRRSAYRAVNGHAAVHSAICEDAALAGLIKQSGRQVLLADGQTALTARMYRGWTDLWPGLSKNMVEMLGGPAATVITAALVVLASAISILLPALLAERCADGTTSSCIAALPAAAATAALVGLHVAGAVYLRIPFWYGLLFPLGYWLGACLAIESVRRHRKGRIVWKGRIYP